MKNKKRRVLPVAIALVAILAISGVAYAYWSSSGNGTGSATTGTSMALTVAQVGGPTTGLVPDGTTHNVVVRVTNDIATFSQSFRSVAITVTLAANGTDVQGAPAGCLAAWFTVVNPAPATVVLAVGAHSDVTGTIAMTGSDTVNQDACKGVSIPLTFAVTTP